MPHDPDLTPTEEQVRRLLADARHTEPMPEDVAARLDGVLAGLATEDPSAARLAVGQVDDLDNSAVRAAELAVVRRRRTARNLLVAAAAVVAVGVGLNAAHLTVSGNDANRASSGSADSAAESAPHPASEGGGAALGSTLDDAPSATAGSMSPDFGAYAPRDGRPVHLTAAGFGTEVRRLRAQTKAVTLNDLDSYSTATDGLMVLGRVPQPGCPTTGWGAGLLVPVRYAGDLGALVFRAASGETQVVDLFLCGSDEPARSITLPVR